MGVCLCDPKSLASQEAIGWSREPWPQRLCSGPCPSVLDIWGPGTEGRGQGEGGGSGEEERGYRRSSNIWERCPQGVCASRVKRPPLFLWRIVHPNPGDRPTTPFLKACRLIPTRHQCKHLQYAHKRAAAVCPKAGLRGASSMARKRSFSLSFWGYRTGTVGLLKSLSLGTRPETAAAAATTTKAP